METLEELGWMDSPSKEKAREKVKDNWLSGEDKDACSPLQFLLTFMHLTQAMAIKEHIGYPDYILQDSNPKLDQEYAHVSTK